MATNEPTTVVNGKVSNPREIAWPFDTWGFTSMLRKEGARAVGRIKGHPEKLDIFLHTLKALGEHAKARFEVQEKEAAKTIAAMENRIKAAEAMEVANQEREITRLKGLLAEAEKTLKSRQAKVAPKGTPKGGA